MSLAARERALRGLTAAALPLPPSPYAAAGDVDRWPDFDRDVERERERRLPPPPPRCDEVDDELLTLEGEKSFFRPRLCERESVGSSSVSLGTKMLSTSAPRKERSLNCLRDELEVLIDESDSGRLSTGAAAPRVALAGAGGATDVLRLRPRLSSSSSMIIADSPRSLCCFVPGADDLGRCGEFLLL